MATQFIGDKRTWKALWPSRLDVYNVTDGNGELARPLNRKRFLHTFWKFFIE